MHSVGFMWNNQDYMLHMYHDVDFLRLTRGVMVKALVNAEKERLLRQKSYVGDLAENPLETVPLEIIAKLLESADRVVKLFEELDESGDRRLQRKEFEMLLERLGIDISSDDKAHFYFVLDRDGDGEICCKEFLNAIRATEQARRVDTLRLQRAETALQGAWRKAVAAADERRGGGGGGQGNRNGCASEGQAHRTSRESCFAFLFSSGRAH